MDVQCKSRSSRSREGQDHATNARGIDTFEKTVPLHLGVHGAHKKVTKDAKRDQQSALTAKGDIHPTAKCA